MGFLDLLAGETLSTERTWADRVFDVGIGLSVLSWTVLGLLYAPVADQFTVPRLTIATLNASVGILFLLRGPTLVRSSLQVAAVAVPSIVISGVALKLAPPAHAWSLAAQALFVAGAVVAIVALCTLGRSFAVLPALRGNVVQGGPYRLVRHPTYFGELMMLAACAVAAGTWLAALPALLAGPFLAARIMAEEKLLHRAPAYAQYTAQVRWRLLPGLW